MNDQHRRQIFVKIREQLKACPTCGGVLVQSPGTGKMLLLRCKDIFHGNFAVTWSDENRNYNIAYIPKQRSLE